MIKYNSFFWKQVRLYFLWIVIFCIATASLTQYLYIQMEKEIYKNGLDGLKHSIQLTDAALKEVEKEAYNLALDTDILKLFNQERNNGQANYDDLYNVFINIKSYVFMSDLVEQYFIYLYKSKIIMSNTTASERSEIFYNSSINYVDITYEQWHEQVYTSMDDEYIVKDRQYENKMIKPAIDYQVALPFGIKSKSTGCLIVTINTNKLMDILNTADTSDVAYAIKKDDKIIIAQNKAQYDESVFDVVDVGVNKIDNLYQIVEKSSNTGWYYIAVIPRNSMMRQAITIRNIGLLILLLFLLLGIIAIAYTASRTSNSINNIYSLLPIDSTGSQDMIQNIQASIKTMVTKNESLNVQLKEQRTIAKESFLTKLSMHYFSNVGELEIYIDYADIKHLEPPYVLAIGKIDLPLDNQDKDYYDEYDKARLLISNLLKDRFKDKVVLRGMTIEKIAILVSDYKKDDEYIRDAFKEFAIKTNKSMIVHLGFVVSDKFDNLIDFPIIYSDIDSLFTSKFIRGKEVIIRADDIGVDDYKYSIENELRLINIIKSGNKKVARDYIDEILNKYKQLDEKSITSLLDDIYNTLKKVVYNQLDGAIKKEALLSMTKLKNTHYVYEYKQKIYEMTEILSDIFSPDNHKYKLLDNINKFIDENYMSPELGLSMLASYLHMSEKYISRFYKNSTSINISSYIEKVRMQRASEMISEGKTNFNEIAYEVGYYNYNTFYKAFYRYFGTSPKSHGK